MLLSKKFLIEQGLITSKTHAVYDPAFRESLKTMPIEKLLNDYEPSKCIKKYLDTIEQWILASRLNRVVGLEKFPFKHLTIGTTQVFDEAYYRYAHRRLRVFKGEYAYHKRIMGDVVFLEDRPLDKGDYVIISAPFCSTGDLHPSMHEMLDFAEFLQVPVIIDCAYFGTCVEMNLDFTHPAITMVVFSLTKGVGLGEMRSGVRFSHLDDHLPICQQNRYGHTILLDAKIGIYMMEKFSSDFIGESYLDLQKEVCRDAEIIPTKCMHLALGEEEWNDFNVAGMYNRLGIRELIRARKEKRI